MRRWNPTPAALGWPRNRTTPPRSRPVGTPGVSLAPAPQAPISAPYGSCDVPWGVHGVRYSALAGWHTWNRSPVFVPLSEFRRRYPNRVPQGDLR